MTASAKLHSTRLRSSRSTIGFIWRHSNHLTPFPGTPLFARLQREGRLIYERWWVDERYGYNGIPFQPAAMAPDDIRQGCLRARRRFYAWRSMLRRAFDPVTRPTPSCSATSS
jgi:radical SAM superfamily enzyme YgiQ (UPF0313 family)